MAGSKAEDFLSEIRNLMERYGATLDEGEDYDEEERYRGSRKYVVVDGQRFELDELMPEKKV